MNLVIPLEVIHCPLRHVAGPYTGLGVVVNTVEVVEAAWVVEVITWEVDVAAAGWVVEVIAADLVAVELVEEGTMVVGAAVRNCVYLRREA